jgi:hypothetical protein
VGAGGGRGVVGVNGNAHFHRKSRMEWVGRGGIRMGGKMRRCGFV